MRRKIQPLAHAARALCLGAALTFACVHEARSQGPEKAAELAATYNAALQAFNAARYPEAAAGIEKVLALAVDPAIQPQMENAWFTLGAAYFNQPDYPKAIATFEKFEAKYPASPQKSEVRLRRAQSLALNKQLDDAVKIYQDIEKDPATRELALAAQIDLYRQLKKNDELVKVLEKLSPAAKEITTAQQAKAAIFLAEKYAELNAPERAILVLDKVRARPQLVENLPYLNAVAIKLGDEFAEKSLYPQALATYRAVQPRASVIATMRERIKLIERRIADNSVPIEGRPQEQAKRTMENNQLKPLLDEARRITEEFEKLPDFAPPLALRTARIWHDAEKKWEAITAYKSLLERFPNSKTERELALYGIVVNFADLNRPLQTKDWCDAYLKEFPTGQNASFVGYISGAVALQNGDPATAESFFGVMLEKQPNSEYREQMRYLLGNAKFAQAKYEEAIKDYDLYITGYPQGEVLEEVVYRKAAAAFFLGKYEDALAQLNAYVTKYPKGYYAPDGRYRIAVCHYAAEQYADVAAKCQEWERDFPNDQMLGEVLSLRGDAEAALGKKEEAAETYIRSYKAATSDEVINYSLFEGGKLLQKVGNWERLVAVFEDFVKSKPEHPSAVSAMYWIGRGKARLGQAEEAKTFLVGQIARYYNDPKREAVEQLLQQLAQLCLRATHKPEPGAAAPAPYDAFAELERQIAPLAASAKPTGQARLLFTKAELCTLKKQPAEREKTIREIADKFRPDDLSPALLAMVGDFLLEKNDQPRASALYTKLRDDFPRSEFLDVAFVGLGEVAFRLKQHDKALELFTTAIDKIPAAMKYKEAHVGKAKALLELGRFDEAKKMFEQIAAIKEWRGESTAFALYSLGEIEARQNRWAEAIAQFRRVFIAYQKYPDWVARSYLRAADCFEKLGKKDDAKATLQDMARNEKLERLPETKEAMERLRKL